jgi:hypothetical protein
MNESLTTITQCFGLNRTTQVQEKKRKTSNGTIGQKENQIGHGFTREVRTRLATDLI